MEVFLDKVNNSFIINLKNLKIEIPVEKIEFIKEGILVKRFISKEVLKDENYFIIKASNFGINYLYVFEKLKDFVVLTFKLRDFKFDYVVITLSRRFYQILKENLEGFKEKILNKTKD